MRTAHVIVASIILLGAVAIAVAVAVQLLGNGPVSPPGQYPIGAPRYEWPVSEKIAPYRPGSVMGSDAALVAGGTDTKAMCVSVPDCTGKPPTIPIEPNYSGIIADETN